MMMRARAANVLNEAAAERGLIVKGTQSLRHYTQEEGDTAEASTATQSTAYDKPKRGTLQKLLIYRHESV